MRLKGYDAVGGRHTETSVLRNMLIHGGVKAAHTGEPYTEAMLLGLGGGLGGGYFAWAFTHGSHLVLGARALWQDSRAFMERLCERIGLPAGLQETSAVKTAQKQLDEALAAGRPVMAWVDMASLPYQHLHEELKKYILHVVGICGTDEATGAVLVDDRAPVPWPVAPGDLATARATIGTAKNRLLSVTPPGKKVDLKAAIRAAIADCHEGLTNPPIRNFGLPAVDKWADLVANPKDKKGWPKLFPGPRLYQALTATYRGVETSGTGGGAFRPMYAEFLEEASGVLRAKGLKDLAGRYRELGARWTAFAESALPDTVKPFKQARELLARRGQLFEQRGAAAARDIAKVDESLDKLEAQVLEDFPLDEKQSQELLLGLRERLRELHEAEVAAVEELRSAAG